MKAYRIDSMHFAPTGAKYSFQPPDIKDGRGPIGHMVTPKSFFFFVFPVS